MMIRPMLAQTAHQPFSNGNGFIFEPKLDGVRCIATLDGLTKLQARSGADISAKFPELNNLHQQAKRPCVIDGEIVSLDFNAIQHRIHKTRPFDIKVAQMRYPATFYAFDILYVDREQVETKPLLDRKVLLASLFAESPQGRVIDYYSDYFVAQRLCKDLEGVMAKAVHSLYIEGKRSDDWLKLKNFKEAEYFICGVTQGENDRSSTFGSLILGDGQKYVGNVGSGFTQDTLKMLLHLLEPLKGDCPFSVMPDVDRPVKFWVRPELKCEVRFLELPTNGKLRFPTFRRLV